MQSIRSSVDCSVSIWIWGFYSLFLAHSEDSLARVSRRDNTAGVARFHGRATVCPDSSMQEFVSKHSHTNQPQSSVRSCSFAHGLSFDPLTQNRFQTAPFLISDSLVSILYSDPRSTAHCREQRVHPGYCVITTKHVQSHQITSPEIGRAHV